MSIRVISNRGFNDLSINKKISNIMLTQYKKGLSKKNNEINEENGSSGDNTVDTVNPTNLIQLPKTPLSKNSKLMTQSVPQTSYSVKRASPKTGIQPPTKAREFIVQSHILDNELDQMIALMKLNNKEEFYGGSIQGGALYTEDEKSYWREKATQDELYNEFELLMTEMMDANDADEDTDEFYAKIKFIESAMVYNSTDIVEIIEHLGKYENLVDESDKQVVEDVIKRFTGDIPTAVEAMEKMGYSIDRDRSRAPGKYSDLNNITAQNLWDSYSGANSNIKAKKGIRVTGSVDTKHMSTEVLNIIRKISNIVSITLSPLAQNLKDNRFQGLTEQDKVTIPKLYSEMDEKMYILTSLNNTSNTQLLKLDKEFDKLYYLVQSGIDSHVPSAGGSMFGSNVYKTDKLYLL
jgi:hypothetical protein